MTIPLIARQVFFGNPDRANVRISPDGRWLSYLSAVNGVLNVWVAPLEDLAAARPITQDTNRGIRYYVWAYDNQHILYIQDKGGDENWRLYATHIETAATRDLTPVEGTRAEISKVSHHHPGAVLVGLNDRLPQLHDLYRIEIATGERTLVQENPGFVGFVSDDHFEVRMAIQMTPQGGADVFLRAADGDWTPYYQIGRDDLLTTQAFGFNQMGDKLYLRDSRGRDTAALMLMDMETQVVELLAEDPRADLSDVLLHPRTQEAQAAAFNYERKAWQVLDQSIADDLRYLATVADGELEIVSRNLDDDRWVVAYEMDNGPAHYYLYDRAARSTQFLFTNNSQLEGLALAKMHPVIIPARDGLKLVSYYTLPVGSDADGDGIPDAPLPLVLMVHGGPWGRDEWGYNPIHQWLANRGYAVLSVNFRASTGFGKAFINAGDLQWGRAMQDDLNDAVDWAVAKGIAEAERVAIMGGSYGGYATLAGVTMHPEKFACGVDIVGPSNLQTLLESIPPYWEPQVEMLTSRIGDHRTEAGRTLLRERSPLTYADRIQRPLLIGQGANDPRVKQAESDQIVTAMQAKDIPVTYVLYPDEGHGFARPENRLSFFAIAEAFLAGVMEQPFEPIGADFTDSSVAVPVGADYVPGLTDALDAAMRTG